MEWIQVAEDRVKGRARVNTERNFGFLKMRAIFWPHERLLAPAVGPFGLRFSDPDAQTHDLHDERCENPKYLILRNVTKGAHITVLLGSKIHLSCV